MFLLVRQCDERMKQACALLWHFSYLLHHQQVAKLPDFCKCFGSCLHIYNSRNLRCTWDIQEFDCDFAYSETRRFGAGTGHRLDCWGAWCSSRRKTMAGEWIDRSVYLTVHYSVAIAQVKLTLNNILTSLYVLLIHKDILYSNRLEG
jgi:hypothetical protein